MKTTSLLAAIVLLASACYSSTPRYADRAPVDRREQMAQSFDAYTTDGQFVRVQPDARTGQLVITDPANLSGDTVAMVNRDGGQGYPLVAIESYRGWRPEDRDERQEHHGVQR